MSNPVLVEVLRGPLVESRHAGAVAVVDADGGRALALGEVELPVFPRSAVKALQALPLVESGAADRYGLGPQELALACASHSGEPGHVATATRMLTQAGLDAGALKCGAHWPIHQPSGQALARAGGTASALHNNCSGKHAGFLCVSCALGADPARYTELDHPVQRFVRSVLADLTGAILSKEVCAIDADMMSVSVRTPASGTLPFTDQTACCSSLTSVVDFGRSVRITYDTLRWTRTLSVQKSFMTIGQ